MQKKKRHSKFKNAGILYELLVKQITSDIIAEKETSFAKDLLFKYFRPKTALGKEWRLYNALMTEKINDETKAERFLNTVINSRRKLDEKQLQEEKYKLIKEVKALYPIDEFFKTPIRNYRLLASIFKVFEDGVSSETRFVINEVYQAKNCIVENLVDKPKSLVNESEDELIEIYKKESEDIRLLAYKLMVERVNQKWSGVLDADQKEVLREYINNISNTNRLGEFVTEKLTEVKEKLVGLVDKIDCDVTKIKVQEVINQLETVKPGKLVKDNQIMVLMMGYELIKEISNKSKK